MAYRIAHRDDGSVTASTGVRARFPGPFDVPTPAGAEGWQELYAYSLPFHADRRDYEESVFWFRETIHWPRPLRPFEGVFVQYALTSLSQFNHRHYLVPGARGLDFRVLNGYCYLSPGAIDDPVEVAERSVAFAARAGYYYEHWDDLYAGWMDKIRALLDRLDGLSFPSLPDMVPFEEIASGRGLGRPYDLARRYHELLDLGVELWQYHFEFLNLGYAAYLDYFGFCRSLFPDISDLVVARMVAGIDVDLFRPDQELRRLARAAVDGGLAEVLCEGPIDDALAGLAALPGGRDWLDDFERTQYPWFNYSTGSGFYHDDPVWADRLDIPLGFIRNYVRQLRAGHGIDTPTQEVADEGDRLAQEVRAVLVGPDLDQFDAKLRLARTVFHFVENHNFYVEHWGMSSLWRKLREFSAIFVKDGFWNTTDDLFFLRPEEVETALWDMLGGWANGTPARGPKCWPAEIERRRAIVDACSASSPPPALGVPPESVSEPFTIMLWGITTDSVNSWLSSAGAGAEMHGLAASAGRVVGRARVVLSVEQLDDVEDGEILVAKLTSPSWAPVFGRIAGTVTEVGGMMSHTAIVCREYGLAAVTGVHHATRVIRTGQLVRVDGCTGIVSILD